MSVMACDREGCENTMCDRLSDKYGYICESCFAEALYANNLDPSEFMASKKPEPATFVQESFEAEFPYILRNELCSFMDKQ